MEKRIPQMLQSGQLGGVTQAQRLLKTVAEEDAPITQFYLGVATGIIDGEAAACDHYERALKQLPLLHAARNNLIRGLMRRGSAKDRTKALEHANLSAGLQPEVAEMQYQLGVVQMQLKMPKEAAGSYEMALKLEPTHAGALVNGVHCLQMLPPGDQVARARLRKLAEHGVRAGLWNNWMQRPPHTVAGLRSQPWWSKRDFPWCALLERNYPSIREEVLGIINKPKDAFTPVGGRAAHDSTLVAAGEWKEFPLFGNGQRYDENCSRCPVTAKTMECVPAAMELSMAAGGETIFSTLKPGTHLRPHCGSTNTRLTCHLGILVPDGCRIRAGDEWRGWKEGECIVFDDSWEHEVMHEGTSDRIVLLINFWHPDLAPDQRRIDINTHGYEAI